MDHFVLERLWAALRADVDMDCPTTSRDRSEIENLAAVPALSGFRQTKIVVRTATEALRARPSERSPRDQELTQLFVILIGDKVAAPPDLIVARMLIFGAPTVSS